MLTQYCKGRPFAGDDSFLVIPIGGTNRVGLNMTLVGHNGRWIMIDAGATFVPSDDTEAEAYAHTQGGCLGPLIPDLTAISAFLPTIDAIVITHSHEDHIGALPYLYQFAQFWPEFIQIPVYATPYTAHCITKKFSRSISRPKVMTVDQSEAIKIGGFTIEWVPVTHSAPETSLIAITATPGTIVFASDAKLDSDPVIGPLTDTDRLEQLGHAGVLAFFADSTNTFRSGRSTSEGDVQDSLVDIMKEFDGRIFLSTFASNLARVESATVAGHGSGRRMSILGSTLNRNIQAAIRTDILPDGFHDRFQPNLAGCDPRQSLVICTGTQAEPNSALARIAESILMNEVSPDHPIGPGDLIIHSARTIPGNELSVQSMFEIFRERGIHVLTTDDHLPGLPIHASGHGHWEEIRDFYDMMKPRFAVPVHGDRNLINAHIEQTRPLPYIEKAISPEEGQILRISPAGAELVGYIETGILGTIKTNMDGPARRLITWPPSTELAVHAA